MFGYASHRTIEFIDCHIPAVVKKSIKRILPGFSQKYYRLLSRLTGNGFDLVEIRGGLLGGRKFTCSLKKERDFWLGKWEMEVQDVMKARLRPGMIVYDIGAHIGFFSLMAAQLVQPTGRVFAFEPSAANRELNEKNLSLNPDLSHLIELLPFALSDEVGFATLMSADEVSTTATLVREPASLREDARKVPTITLDEFLQRGNPPPQFIKMDIEGGETFAFSGMVETLRSHRPALVVEIHDSEAWRGFGELLHRVDYAATSINEIQFLTNPEWNQRDQYLALPAEQIQKERTAQ